MLAKLAVVEKQLATLQSVRTITLRSPVHISVVQVEDDRSQMRSKLVAVEQQLSALQAVICGVRVCEPGLKVEQERNVLKTQLETQASALQTVSPWPASCVNRCADGARAQRAQRNA